MIKKSVPIKDDLGDSLLLTLAGKKGSYLFCGINVGGFLALAKFRGKGGYRHQGFPALIGNNLTIHVESAAIDAQAWPCISATYPFADSLLTKCARAFTPKCSCHNSGTLPCPGGFAGLSANLFLGQFHPFCLVRVWGPEATNTHCHFPE